MAALDRSDRVPALVVSGFLGSGKTTLVRHLLEDAARQGLRVALISNELGELGVDRALLGQGGEAYVELEGGCVCCELSDDLVLTLQMLRERVDPDRVVIETSGVALPFDTTLNFWRDPVREWLGDDTAVVVVNAEQVAEGRDLEGTFEDQISSADMLVLNKIDLVSKRVLEEIEITLRALEPEAPIVRCVQGRVETSLLFPPDPQPGGGAREGLAPSSPVHHHEHFETETWRVPEGISTPELEERLRDPSLLRAKGWVATEAGTRFVQVVGRRIEFSEEPPGDPALVGRIVMIRRASGARGSSSSEASRSSGPSSPASGPSSPASGPRSKPASKR